MIIKNTLALLGLHPNVSLFQILSRYANSEWWYPKWTAETDNRYGSGGFFFASFWVCVHTWGQILYLKQPSLLLKRIFLTKELVLHRIIYKWKAASKHIIWYSTVEELKFPPLSQLKRVQSAIIDLPAVLFHICQYGTTGTGTTGVEQQ